MYDLNDCDPPGFDSQACYLSANTPTWSASGCGATPANGRGANAEFIINSTGTVTLAFAVTGADTCGNTYSQSCSQTFTVSALNGQCTPKAPPENKQRLTFGGGPINFTCLTWTDGSATQHNVVGNLAPVYGDETFAPYAGIAGVSPCGSIIQGLDYSLGTPAQFSISLAVPTFPFGIALSPETDPTQSGYTLYTGQTSAVNNLFWNGLPWQGTIKTGKISFTGTDTWYDCDPDGVPYGKGTVITYNGDGCSLIGLPDVPLEILGTVCSAPCCGN